MKLQIILPMAGRGSRVKSLKEDVPKPLVKLKDIPLFRWSLKFFQDSIEFQDNLHYFPIIRQEHFIHFENELNENEKRNLIVLENETRGALETVSKVFNMLDPMSPVVCLDSDLSFKCHQLKKSIFQEFNGALLTFNSNEPKYSYVKQVNGIAKEIAEKKVISDRAICGAYCISKASDLIEVGSRILTDSGEHFQNGELYISSLFKELINLDRKIAVLDTDDFLTLGTSEEIKLARQK